MASELDFRHVSAAVGEGAAGAADLAPPGGKRLAAGDTGPLQPHARGPCESEGYMAIENFNGNPVATFFGEKRLAG